MTGVPTADRAEAPLVNFYLPVTSQPRELDAKLLLALVARERGHQAWIGYKSVFQNRLGALEPGVFLIHNARQDTKRVRLTRDHGHRVLVLDEEALVRQTDEIFLKKHPEGAFDPVSRILCWGEDDSELWRRNGIGDDNRRAVVGNPRFDLLRPELAGFFGAQVASIKARYGDYLLLNTNFPTVNNLTPQGGGVRLAPWAMDERGQSLSDMFLANKRAMLDAMVALVAPLARAIEPSTLVIRPHPNEDHGRWREAVRGIPNAHVAFEGGVAPWLIGATALLHNNCTTAVEAAAARVPVINFRPWATEFDNPLSNAFGQTCGSAGEAASAFAAIRARGRGELSPAEMARLRHHVRNVEGPLSCEHIVEAAEAAFAGPESRAGHGRVSRRLAVARMRLTWLARYIKLFRSASGRARRRHVSENYPGLRLAKLDHEQLKYSKEQFDLLMRQFPPLEAEDLDDRIRRFGAATGRFGAFRVRMLSQQLFQID